MGCVFTGCTGCAACKNRPRNDLDYVSGGTLNLAYLTSRQLHTEAHWPCFWGQRTMTYWMTSVCRNFRVNRGRSVCTQQATLWPSWLNCTSTARQAPAISVPVRPRQCSRQSRRVGGPRDDEVEMYRAPPGEWVWACTTHPVSQSKAFTRPSINRHFGAWMTVDPTSHNRTIHQSFLAFSITHSMSVLPRGTE